MNVTTTTTTTIHEQAQLARDAQLFNARQVAGYLLITRILNHVDHIDDVSAHNLLAEIRLELAKQMRWDIYRIASDVAQQFLTLGVL